MTNALHSTLPKKIATFALLVSVGRVVAKLGVSCGRDKLFPRPEDIEVEEMEQPVAHVMANATNIGIKNLAPQRLTRSATFEDVRRVFFTWHFISNLL